MNGSCGGWGCSLLLALMGVGVSSTAAFPITSADIWQVALPLRLTSTVGISCGGRGGVLLLAAAAPVPVAAAAHQLLPGAASDVTCWPAGRPGGGASPGWRGRLLATPCWVGRGRHTLPWFSTVLFRMSVEPLRLVTPPAVLSVLQLISTTLLYSRVKPGASWKRPSIELQSIQKGPLAAAADAREAAAGSRGAPAAAARDSASAEADMMVTLRLMMVAGKASLAGNGHVFNENVTWLWCCGVVGVGVLVVGMCSGRQATPRRAKGPCAPLRPNSGKQGPPSQMIILPAVLAVFCLAPCMHARQ